MLGVGWQVVVVGDGGRGQYVTHIHKFERLARKSWNNRSGRKIFAVHSARDTSGRSARPLVSKRAALVRDPLCLAAGRLLFHSLSKMVVHVKCTVICLDKDIYWCILDGVSEGKRAIYIFNIIWLLSTNVSMYMFWCLMFFCSKIYLRSLECALFSMMI